MRKRLILAIAILIVAAAGVTAAWFGYKHTFAPKPKPSPPVKSSRAEREKNHVELSGNKIVVLVNESVFGPKDATIKAGSAVEWTNMETTTHQVVTDDGTTIPAATSPVLAQGQSYDFEFKKPGTYAYHDNLHPKMQGTIKVE
jgi:plastocyanin